MGRGFEGSVVNLPLVDLLQLESMNRFTGAVILSLAGSSGRLHFVLGEIIHAESDHEQGEAAVRRVLSWQGGHFEVRPGPASPVRTISKRFNHLMLDCHASLDEERRAGDSSPSPAPVPLPRPSAPGLPPSELKAVLDQLKGLPGVEALVRCGPDGQPQGDDIPHAQALARRGMALGGPTAAAVSKVLGLGRLVSACVSSAGGGMLFFPGTSSGLVLACAPGLPAGQLEAQVRTILSRGKGR